MANELDDIKRLSVTEVLDLANNKHIIDAFVTDEYNEQEIVVAIVARVRIADIKTKHSWKASVVDAKRSRDLSSVEINTEPESRVPSNSVIQHLDTGKIYSDYGGYNKEKQQKYIKSNGKKSLERYQQFYAEPNKPTD